MGNEKLREAMYGAIVGDALGVPYEFKRRGTFRCTGMAGYGTHHQPAGTWSDDSSMLLATCKSIQENTGKIVIEDLRDKFRQWLTEGRFTPFGEVFDCGITTRQAVLSGKARDDERSNGNGSLMRILPLAFTDCSDDEIRAVSAITHGHRISQEACVIFVHIIRDVRKIRAEQGQTPPDALAEIVRSLDLPAPFDRLKGIASLPEEDIRSSGYVVDTLEAALWCVLTSKDYGECVCKAVNLGDDTDTVACVAGGLGCAVKYGFESIPGAWVNEIKNSGLIQDCLF